VDENFTGKDYHICPSCHSVDFEETDEEVAEVYQIKIPLHPISSDENMYPELKQRVQSIRGAISSRADRNQLPERFVVTQNPDHPRMVITDTITGNATDVPLFAYGEVRQVLNDLFK